MLNGLTIGFGRFLVCIRSHPIGCSISSERIVLVNYLWIAIHVREGSVGGKHGHLPLSWAGIVETIDVRHRRMSQLFRSFILGRLITLIHAKDPLFPAITSTQPVLAILAGAVLNGGRLLADKFKKLNVSRHLLETIKSRNEVESNESLRIHVTAEVHVFEQIVDREVVLNLLRDAREHREVIYVRTVGAGTHRLRHHIVVVHAVTLHRRHLSSILVLRVAISIRSDRLGAVTVAAIFALRCREEAWVLWIECRGRSGAYWKWVGCLHRWQVTIAVLVTGGVASAPTTVASTALAATGVRAKAT